MDNPQKLINNQRRIGLTGGIASGKSTVAKYISEHKRIPILDADNFSKELIKPNTIGYKKILNYFGNNIIDKTTSENAIDREQTIKLTLTKSADEYNDQEVMLNLDEKYLNTSHVQTYKSIQFIIKRTFTNDFDF